MSKSSFRLCLIISTIFNLFFLFSFTSKASAYYNDDYFPMHQNANGLIPEECQNAIETFFGSDNNNIFIEYWSHNSYYYKYYVCYFPKDSNGTIYAEVLSNGYEFSLYNFNSVSIYSYEVYVYLSDYHIEPYSIYFSTFQNLQSSIYSDGWDYASNFQVYTNNSEDEIILKYGADDPVVPDLQGHAIPPDFDGLNPAVNSGSNHTLPREVPDSPSINNYTWITYNPPSIDTTNVESLLESLIYVINYLAGWLKDNLAGEFQNLISNIKSLVEFIANTIQYYGGLIIDNIQNAVTNLYDNLSALFENVTTFFNNIIYLGTDENGDFSVGTLLTNVFTILFVPSDEELYALLTDNDTFGVVTMGSNLVTFYGNFVNHLKTDTAIYVIEIPAFVFAGVSCGPYYISFQWYYDNYKSVGDPIISAFLVFGFFMWLYHRFPYWLRAQQGDVSRAVTEVKKE